MGKFNIVVRENRLSFDLNDKDTKKHIYSIADVKSVDEVMDSNGNTWITVKGDSNSPKARRYKAHAWVKFCCEDPESVIYEFDAAKARLDEIVSKSRRRLIERNIAGKYELSC